MSRVLRHIELAHSLLPPIDFTLINYPFPLLLWALKLVEHVDGLDFLTF
jgi:hypothetical protein